MVYKTSEYYSQFTSTISAGTLKKWTKDITSAESQRFKDPSAMDIIGTQLHLHGVSHDPAQSRPNVNRSTGAALQWITLALSTEELQYVFKFYLFNIK